MGVFKNGKRNGLETTWYESGKKLSESNFKNGERDGLITGWYENGNKIETYHFKNDQLNGEQTKWYESSQKKQPDTTKMEKRMESDKSGMKTEN
jgi:antitoxin component YwqK of YwqJK toxin-antitoxin module